jgi:hypothetical protein
MLRNGHVRFGGRAAETTSRKTGTALLPDPCSYVRAWLGFVYVAFIVDVSPSASSPGMPRPARSPSW